MITKVMISGLDVRTIKRLDRILGGSVWRFDARENGHNLYDVDVSNSCDVLYCSNSEAINAVVISNGDLCAGLKAEDFDSIIAG